MHKKGQVPEVPKLALLAFFILLKYENELEIVASDISFIQYALDISKSVFKFIWLAAISNFHLKLHENANNTNFGSFKNTRVCVDKDPDKQQNSRGFRK